MFINAIALQYTYEEVPYIHTQMQYIHTEVRKYTQFTLYARAGHDNSVTGIIKRRSKLY